MTLPRTLIQNLLSSEESGTAQLWPEFIDDPKDLLAFALTSRIFYSEIVPKHIDYRRISCRKSSETVWKHLSESPYTRHVRYLNLMDNCYHPRIIPRAVCGDVGVDQHAVDRHVGRMDFNLNAFIQALSKMTNLKVLKFSIDGRPSAKTICTISRALEEAGCQLEELETQFRLHSIIKRYIKRSGAIIKDSQDCLLFCKHWLSLKKCIITSINGNGRTLSDRDSDLSLQMLLNASNLTHMCTNFVSSTILSASWPNLEHLTIYSNHALQGDQIELEYIIHLRSFFIRHSKLITLSTRNIIIPGWTIEADDFLPNLISLGLVFPLTVNPDISLGRVITSNMAARLTHLDMSDLLLSFLKKARNHLSQCRLMLLPRGRTRTIDDTKTTPNITKLHIVFGHHQIPQPKQALNIGFGGFAVNAQRPLTANEFQMSEGAFWTFR
ncbi:hypothetical protein Clacol_003944 [Clathrus columnatus]|uniref:F-box domain-containing protein n=1 Tax=Clathrus columnatus TaxID=1419009 RepID=A0AAV5A610_9AGAM|nr:hypothetical protein Clacol_003944 [Clathrus columnatus]